MYSTSNVYDTQIAKTSRRFTARISIDGEILQQEIKSLTLTTGSCGEEKFDFGVVFASYVDMVLEFGNVALANKELFVELGLVLPDNTVEYVPMGYFTVQPGNLLISSDRINLKASDRISTKCNVTYEPTITFPATIQEILDDISNEIGVEIRTSFVLSGMVQESMKDLFVREVFGYISGLLGGYCFVDRTGVIRIERYPVTASRSIATDIVMDIQVGEDAYRIDTVMVTVSEDGTDVNGNDVAGLSYISGTGAGEKIIKTNPYMTQEMFDDMADLLVGYSYHPGTVTFLGDPRLDPNDAIEVYDHTGQTYLLPCMSIVQDFDGGLTTMIIAPGQSASETMFQGPLTQKINRLATEVILAKYVLATRISADEVAAKYATIEEADIIKASITEVSGDLANFKNIVADDFKAANAEIDKLKSSQITTDYLEANYAKIDLANIAAGTITSAMIETGAIGTAQIADGSITDAKIVGLTASKITAGVLDAGTIDVINLNAANITVGTINGQQIAQGAIDVGNLSASLNTTIVDTSKVANDAYNAITNLEVGARNLIRNSKTMIFGDYYFSEGSVRGDYLVDESGNVLMDESGNIIIDYIEADIILDEYGQILLDESGNMLVT